MSKEPPIELRAHLEPHQGNHSPGPHEKRFDCFLIDTGWNESVSKLVRSHLPMYFGPGNPDPLYILSHEQSVEILKREPHLIGNDPIVIVYDLYPPPVGKSRGKYKGFRLNLGLMRHPQQALARLQDFVRFVMIHRKSMRLEADVVKEMHREGFQGMVKVLHDVSEKSIELVQWVARSPRRLSGSQTMNEEVPIIPIVLGALAVFYVGYEVERHRHKLRKVFNVFDKDESVVADALERLVNSGQLQPYGSVLKSS